MGEQILDVADPSHKTVFRATDPAISNVATPGDFAAQFPTPLDTTEILAMCEEISVWRAIPEVRTGLKSYTWREMSSLAMTSGSYHYAAFADGACPEEYQHDGANQTVDLKNIGVKKSLTISDIMHSAAVIGAGGGIQALLGPGQGSSGMPGGSDAGTFMRQQIADLKEKELQLGAVLLMNEWDQMLVNGNATTQTLEFSGITKLASSFSHTNLTTGSFGGPLSGAAGTGTYSAYEFDRWLSEACAKPTHIFGHPAAIQELMSAYFQLGFQGSQFIMANDGNRIIPGFNFASFVNTAVGRIQVVADLNFARTAVGTNQFMSTLYALRMVHNGEPMVYKITQIPMGVVDLVPGCTAISFEIWAKSALIIKGNCFHGAYTSSFGGRVSGTGYTTCTMIG
jgi:hypothetical protein